MLVVSTLPNTNHEHLLPVVMTWRHLLFQVIFFRENFFLFLKVELFLAMIGKSHPFEILLFLMISKSPLFHLILFGLIFVGLV